MKKEKRKIYVIDPVGDLNRRKPDQVLARLKRKIEDIQRFIRRKQEERLTLMLVPHNDSRAKNFHISNFSFSIILGLVTTIVVVSSVLIINHTSTVHQVDMLKISQKDAKIQFKKIREEIQKMETVFSSIRSRLSHLYALSQGKDSNEEPLFGQGGGSVPLESMPASEIVENEGNDENIPAEVYMLNRMLDDMQNSEKPLKEIEKYLQKRAKIIQNTPTLWPVSGYVINPYGYVRNAQTMQTYFNPGVDICASPGAKVISTAPGIITEIRKETVSTYSVRIRHNYGYETVYKGLDRVMVNVDDKVVKGESIGFLAKKVNQDDSILHYLIFVGMDTENPLPYLSYIPN